MRVDEHEGAVEGDKPQDRPQQGNENAQVSGHALDEQGLPEDCDKIAEDVIGANLDETQG
jgi:hypothetical protein